MHATAARRAVPATSLSLPRLGAHGAGTAGTAGARTAETRTAETRTAETRAAQIGGEFSDADFRQLRHQTKNALARILLHLSKHLAPSDPAHRVAAEVERRILLTAELSNALFGLTRAPGPLEQRLRGLCTGLVELLGDPDQQIRLEFAVQGQVPSALEGLLLRVAHELVGNALKHGLHMRLVGRIQVSVAAGPDGTALDVADDGWGCGAAPQPGEGLALSELLAAPHGGTVALRRRGESTVATLWLPAHRSAA